MRKVLIAAVLAAGSLTGCNNTNSGLGNGPKIDPFATSKKKGPSTGNPVPGWLDRLRSGLGG